MRLLIVEDEKDLNRVMSRKTTGNTTNVIDKMLDKIEQTLENEKQFTSDASHELRTPVAVIISECEYISTVQRQASNLRN